MKICVSLFLILQLNSKFLPCVCYGINGIISRLDNFVKNLEASLSPRPQDTHQEDIDSYDFIIIGSGSAGSVIANRLSEISEWKILMLEAGNSPNLLTEIPVLAPLFQLTPYNWNYVVESQKGACLAMVDAKCAWPRGKALGGTSAINYMIYTRGNHHDYDRWAELSNNTWNYNEALKYYKKSENCQLSNRETCNNGFHGNNGYLTIEDSFSSILADTFLRGGQELGAKIVDYNSNNSMGYSKMQANIKNGRRLSSAKAFITPIRKSRSNLKIVTSARVTQILIDPNSDKAFGVRFKHRGISYEINATKEVILSGGVFNSPQLLMLSGIGPRKHLSELGIPIIRDISSVGRNLYDHISFLGLSFKINRVVEPKDALLHPSEIIDYFARGKGIYTSLGGIEALAYINTNNSNADYPDIELILSGGGSVEADFGYVVAREIRLKNEIYEKYYRPLEKSAVFSIFPMLLHPKSMGFMELTSRDPYDKPRFYANYLEDPQDLETLLRSIRYIEKLVASKAFAEFNVTLHDIPFPGCESYKFDSDDYWRCALRSISVSLHHQIGTCKMGEVVDQRLKVYGIDGLRVADSSVIPVTLSGHTNAPAMMIGEKASDLIKEDWGVI